MLPVSTEVNTTQLVVDPVTSAISKMSVRFATPELGQSLTAADPRAFQVRVVVVAPEPNALGVDVALDDQRPRRLSAAEPFVTLGQLTPADGEVLLGEHWLFAAPVLASGLVPRATATAPRAAVARRFFVGTAPQDRSGPSGAVWLRKPEGTYNGPNARAVVFDAFSFSATGAPLELASTIELKSGHLAGELRLRAPFFVREVPSGDYEVTASAASAAPRVTRFTVNRELGGGS
jgi:hypothetical protein